MRNCSTINTSFGRRLENIVSSDFLQGGATGNDGYINATSHRGTLFTGMTAATTTTTAATSATIATIATATTAATTLPLPPSRRFGERISP